MRGAKLEPNVKVIVFVLGLFVVFLASYFLLAWLVEAMTGRPVARNSGWPVRLVVLMITVITMEAVLGVRALIGVRGRCGVCGYSLQGLNRPQCPECGTVI